MCLITTAADAVLRILSHTVKRGVDKRDGHRWQTVCWQRTATASDFAMAQAQLIMSQTWTKGRSLRALSRLSKDVENG